jgi:hypothetical protein
MTYRVSDERFFLAVGETSSRVGEHPAVVVLDRFGSVVLGRSTGQAVIDIQRLEEVIVHVFEREDDARAAFGLYIH